MGTETEVEAVLYYYNIVIIDWHCHPIDILIGVRSCPALFVVPRRS